MPRNGTGSYALPENAFQSGTTISSSAVNSNFSDLASALTQSISRDGQTAVTADLTMSTYKHLNVGNAAARNQYAAAGQVQDGAFLYGTVGGTADIITLNLTPTVTAYSAGQRFVFITGAGANTGAVTLNVNSVGAKDIRRRDGSTALAAGDLPAGALVEVVYDGTRFRLAGVVNEAAIVPGAYGGTGVANTGKTITLGGNFATSGAYALTLTLTAATTVTLPTSGTLATLAGAETLTSKTLRGQSLQYFDSGTTSALDYTNGSHQRWAPTGTVSLTVTNWPASGVLGELLIEGVNLGGATITWPTVNWIKSDGTTTTTFASNGVTLQASGTDWVFLWTRDGGTTVYGKIVR